MIRRGWVVAMMWACGCGGAISKDVAMRSRGLKPSATCAQSFEADVKGLGTKWGEGIEIWALTPRPLRLGAQISADGMPLVEQKPRMVQPATGPDGDRAANGRCLGAPIAAAAPGGDGKGHGGGGHGGGGAAAATAAPELVTVDERVERPDGAVYITGFSGGDDPCGSVFSITSGSAVHVRLWSDAPNDLDGVTFYVVQTKVEPTVPEAEYVKKRKERCDDLLRDATSSSVAEAPPPRPQKKPLGPPPAPKAEAIPPAPSADVEWMPGYWKVSAAGDAWVWIDGHFGARAVATPAATPAAHAAPAAATVEATPAVIVVPPRPRVIVTVPAR